MVENTGNCHLDVIVKDTLPDNMSYVNAFPSPCEIGDVIKWNLSLDANESSYIYLLAHIDSPGILNNTVEAIGKPEYGNNVISFDYAEVILLELNITKTDEKDFVKAGGNNTYIITITNFGNINATGVIVIDDYDESLITIIDTDGGMNDGDKIIWNFPVLNSGEIKTIYLKTKIKSPLPNGTILKNFVNVTCDEGVKNQTWENTTILAWPTLNIEKIDAPDPVDAGGIITYSINISNSGNANATGVIVIDDYDESLITIIDTDGGMNDGDKIIWNNILIPADGYIHFTIIASLTEQAIEGTNFSNFVNVTCNEGAYDEDEAFTLVKSEPPWTRKIFNGSVINVTIWNIDGSYIIHYIPMNTTIDLVANDNGSGVNVTYYRIFRWDDEWVLLFDWEKYGIWNNSLPYYPINLAELGILYNFSPCGKYEIEFYSIDNAGNVEGLKWNDVFVDCISPLSFVEVERKDMEIDIYVNASDVGVGINKIEIYYRYSQDNESWGKWILYDIKTVEKSKTINMTWKFIVENYGYYQFYSIAYDEIGNHEELLQTPKATCRIRNLADVNDDGLVNVYDIYLVILHWLQTPEDENWLPRADVNGDEIIDLYDILEIIYSWSD